MHVECLFVYLSDITIKIKEMSNQENNEIIVTEKSNDTAMYLITKAEIDNQISTAKAYPRSLHEFMETALSMATLNEEIAQSCIYALPRQGKVIEGPSVRLAEIIISSYGNIRAGARVIENDGKTVTAQGICHDLEKNTCVTIETKKRITDKYGKTYSDDMQVVTGNAANSVAFRNAVFKTVPAALVTHIYEKVKEVAKGTVATLEKRRAAALDYFHNLGVTDKQICEVLEIKKTGDIDIDKLSILSGMRSAIKNGESTVKDMFEQEKPVQAKPIATDKELNELINQGMTLEQIETTYTVTDEQKLKLF